MSDTDKASEVESEKKGDCLTPSASILVLFIFVAWGIVRMVPG